MMWSVIKHRLLEGVYKYIPTTLPFASWKKINGKDLELRSMIKQKSILWRRYVRSKDNSVGQCRAVYIQYKKLETKSGTKLGWQKHQNDIAAACKQNSKHFWKNAKSKTTSKEPISDLKYVDSHGNAHVASADNSKAEALCNFFSSVFNNEDDNPFKYLEKKLCEFTSECPTFEVDNIKDRLTK